MRHPKAGQSPALQPQPPVQLAVPLIPKLGTQPEAGALSMREPKFREVSVPGDLLKNGAGGRQLSEARGSGSAPGSQGSESLLRGAEELRGRPSAGPGEWGQLPAPTSPALTHRPSLCA